MEGSQIKKGGQRSNNFLGETIRKDHILNVVIENLVLIEPSGSV